MSGSGGDAKNSFSQRRQTSIDLITKLRDIKNPATKINMVKTILDGFKTLLNDVPPDQKEGSVFFLLLVETDLGTNPNMAWNILCQFVLSFRHIF